MNDPYPPFLGERPSLADARVVVLPIPFEKTTTYVKGCARGPSALLEASQQVETFDDELERDQTSLGIHTAPPIAGTASTPEIMLEEVDHAVTALLERNKFVVGVGGEHSITIGIVQAFLKKYPDLGVLQLDAHGDLRNRYHGSRLNHACVGRRVREMVPLMHVGLRSYCAEEAEWIREKKIPVVAARKFIADPDSALELLSRLPEKIFLTVDLDFFDPSEVPGVGTPEPGGPRWYETLGFLKEVARRKKIIGFDLMELCPRPGSVTSEFFAAKLLYRILGYIHSQD